MKTQSDKNFDNYETLKESMGTENLLDELMQAMSAHECMEYFEHIARMHDIEIEE